MPEIKKAKKILSFSEKCDTFVPLNIPEGYSTTKRYATRSVYILLLLLPLFGPSKGGSLRVVKFDRQNYEFRS